MIIKIGTKIERRMVITTIMIVDLLEMATKEATPVVPKGQVVIIGTDSVVVDLILTITKFVPISCGLHGHKEVNSRRKTNNLLHASFANTLVGEVQKETIKLYQIH